MDTQVVRARILIRVVPVAVLAVLAGCGGSPFSARVPPASSPLPAYVSSLGTEWALAFNGTFTGSRLDKSVWGTCYPWQSPGGCTNFGNANEGEWYQPSQDQVHDGSLNLVARQTPTPGRSGDGSPAEYQFRSGMVTTFPAYNFEYGYVQVVARLPYGDGLWPALWMLATDKKWPPEIDIVEHFDRKPWASQTLHPANLPEQTTAEVTPDLSTGWHTFGLYWSQHTLIWFVDGRRVFTSVRGIPRQSMYFLADLAVNQDHVGRAWNAGRPTLAIRSVQVWQAKDYRR